LEGSEETPRKAPHTCRQKKREEMIESEINPDGFGSNFVLLDTPKIDSDLALEQPLKKGHCSQEGSEAEKVIEGFRARVDGKSTEVQLSEMWGIDPRRAPGELIEVD